MAIGIAKLMGFNITKNFNYPFFAQNIAEYWRKWHISLTSWVTDYVFTPLSISFRNYGKLGLILAILLNLTIVGIWHGANWTFILYGFLHGVYFIPLIISGKLNKKKKSDSKRLFPPFSEFKNILGTFILVMLTNVIFRSRDIPDALSYYSRIISRSIISKPVIPADKVIIITTVAFTFIMLVVEWLQRDKDYGLQITNIKRPVFRWAIYVAAVFCILMFGASGGNQFIYFQF